MLREKRPLKVYTLKKEDCPEFARQAKGYGILYAPIPVRKGDVYKRQVDEKDKTLIDSVPDEGEEVPERKVVGLER